MESVTPKCIAIIGAGPVGLEAAVLADQHGFEVQVFERGRIAQNLCEWGHVRLFSPFGMNVSAWGRGALAARADGAPLPADDALLTGREFAQRYLLPLSRLPQLRGRIHQHTEVCAVSRSRTWKGDLIGKPQRAADPFQLLVRDGTGERIVAADVVFDCSGTYPQHNWLGAGGIPAVGETECAADIDYGLPDVLGADRGRYAGKTTLVVGGGYSAATAVVSLAELAAHEAGTRIIWVTRSDRRPPLMRFQPDPLPERDALAAAANRLALEEGGPVTWRPAGLIRAIERLPRADGFQVSGETTSPWKLTVHRIIGNVGYRPQRRLYEELQVHECYATQGPMKLAAALLGTASADCLQQSSGTADWLANPEPGFFILGAKSYGRDARFLLRIGIEQVRHVVELVAQGRFTPRSRT